MSKKDEEMLFINGCPEIPFLQVNRKAIKEIGIIPSLLIAVYFESRSKQGTKSFICTHASVCKALNITEYTVRRAKKRLLELGIISIELKGAPCKEVITFGGDV